MIGRPSLDLEHIKARLFTKTVNHADDYLPVFELPKSLFEGLKLYLQDKKFNHDFCDLVPIIISRGLNTHIKIYKETNDNRITIHSLEPRENVSDEIAIHLKNLHYSGISFSKAGAGTNDPQTNQRPIQYSSSELKNITEFASKIKRKTRKKLFKNKIWKPTRKSPDTVEIIAAHHLSNVSARTQTETTTKKVSQSGSIH
jgi:hypothetical protein